MTSSLPLEKIVSIYRAAREAQDESKIEQVALALQKQLKTADDVTAIFRSATDAQGTLAELIKTILIDSTNNLVLKRVVSACSNMLALCTDDTRQMIRKNGLASLFCSILARSETSLEVKSILALLLNNFIAGDENSRAHLAQENAEIIILATLDSLDALLSENSNENSISEQYQILSSTCSDMVLVVSQLVMEKIVQKLFSQRAELRARFLTAFERILEKSDHCEIIESISACMYNMVLDSDKFRSEMQKSALARRAAELAPKIDSKIVKSNFENLKIAFSKQSSDVPQIDLAATLKSLAKEFDSRNYAGVASAADLLLSACRSRNHSIIQQINDMGGTKLCVNVMKRLGKSGGEVASKITCLLSLLCDESNDAAALAADLNIVSHCLSLLNTLQNQKIEKVDLSYVEAVLVILECVARCSLPSRLELRAELAADTVARWLRLTDKRVETIQQKAYALCLDLLQLEQPLESTDGVVEMFLALLSLPALKPSAAQALIAFSKDPGNMRIIERSGVFDDLAHLVPELLGEEPEPEPEVEAQPEPEPPAPEPEELPAEPSPEPVHHEEEQPKDELEESMEVKPEVEPVTVSETEAQQEESEAEVAKAAPGAAAEALCTEVEQEPIKEPHGDETVVEPETIIEEAVAEEKPVEIEPEEQSEVVVEQKEVEDHLEVEDDIVQKLVAAALTNVSSHHLLIAQLESTKVEEPQTQAQPVATEEPGQGEGKEAPIAQPVAAAEMTTEPLKDETSITNEENADIVTKRPAAHQVMSTRLDIVFCDTYVPPPKEEPKSPGTPSSVRSVQLNSPQKNSDPKKKCCIV